MVVEVDADSDIIAKMLELIRPILPVLRRMGEKKSNEVLQGLFSDDSFNALLTLRRNCEGDEWQKQVKVFIIKANEYNLQAVLDRQNVMPIIWKIVAAVGLAMIGI